ncbi:MAG: hypothetical protein ACRDYU_02055 [Actinomycetes bacterium]
MKTLKFDVTSPEYQVRKAAYLAPNLNMLVLSRSLTQIARHRSLTAQDAPQLDNLRRQLDDELTRVSTASSDGVAGQEPSEPDAAHAQLIRVRDLLVAAVETLRQADELTRLARDRLR